MKYKPLFAIAKALFFIAGVLCLPLCLVNILYIIPAVFCIALGIKMKPQEMAEAHDAIKKSKTNTKAQTPPPFASKGFSSESPDFVYIDKGEDILKYAPQPTPGLGFANLPEYVVRGKKASTNRMNTRRIRTASIEAVREYAISEEGLIEPLEIAIAEFEPARRLDNGLTVPLGASQWDAREFQFSCDVRDTKHIPAAFMEYATSKSIPLSWLCGRNRAADAVFQKCNLREKAMLYGYAVHCSLHGSVPGNIDKDPRKELYAKFADTAALDIKAWDSISSRPGSDMWEPAKNTNAYRFATEFFQK